MTLRELWEVIANFLTMKFICQQECDGCCNCSCFCLPNSKTKRLSIKTAVEQIEITG